MISSLFKKSILVDASSTTKILFALNFFSISIAFIFLIVYFVMIPFSPAIITQIFYILYCLLLFLLLYFRHTSTVKYGLIIGQFLHLSLTVFVWFPTTTGYYFLYILIPFSSALSFPFNEKKEHYIAIIASFLATLFYFLARIMKPTFYLYETTESMNIIIHSITIFSTIFPMIALFILYTNDIYTLHYRLKKEANTDSLTKIMNRRAMFASGEKIYKKALKSEDSFSLLLLDIDHFKNINDTYGHPIGDMLLVSLVNRIQLQLPKNAIFARYGGEEFAILLENTTLEESEELAKRLLISIRNHPFEINKLHIPVTVSIGHSIYSKDFISYDDMLCCTDNALYKAKENGRNRVVSTNI